MFTPTQAIIDTRKIHAKYHGSTEPTLPLRNRMQSEGAECSSTKVLLPGRDRTRTVSMSSLDSGSVQMKRSRFNCSSSSVSVTEFLMDSLPDLTMDSCDVFREDNTTKNDEERRTARRLERMFSRSQSSLDDSTTAHDEKTHRRSSCVFTG